MVQISETTSIKSRVSVKTYCIRTLTLYPLTASHKYLYSFFSCLNNIAQSCGLLVIVFAALYPQQLKAPLNFLKALAFGAEIITILYVWR